MDLLSPDAGYLAVFLVSFLASTVLPVGSEWLVVALLLQGFEPVLVVVVATLGNTLGAFTTYAIGLWGGQFLVRRLLRINDSALSRARRLYARFGSWSLLLSWLPIVGDPLCALAGLFRTSWPHFAVLVLLGKLARYIVVAWATVAAAPSGAAPGGLMRDANTHRTGPSGYTSLSPIACYWPAPWLNPHCRFGVDGTTGAPMWPPAPRN